VVVTLPSTDNYNNSAMAMVLGYSYCNVPVLPVRKEPFHTAEQTTQMLFGEKAEIQQTNNRDWAKIRCAWDDYEGWCKLSQLTVIQKKEYRKDAKYISGDATGRLIMPQNELLLPVGSELHGMKSGSIKVGNETGKFKGTKIKNGVTELSCANLSQLAKLYLHTPYLWGGRSTWGIDCSGFTQMAYKLCNHRLLRDASQQATQGELVDFLVHGKCGDLAFFDEKEGHINHVGMLLDNETIIHATDSTGRVVIDRIDQHGIISIALKKRTHQLRMVRRMF
jgi:gamma-D-glutamyl-L-lysine dipeptidyl-peptidase